MSLTNSNVNKKPNVTCLRDEEGHQSHDQEDDTGGHGANTHRAKLFFILKILANCMLTSPYW